MPKFSEADVYNLLSYTVWKSPIEIKHELDESLGDKKTVWNGASFGSIYAHLDAIVSRDFAEFRERESSPERLKTRRGNPEREYHLTPNGMNNRDFYEQSPGLVRKLKPA